MPRPAFRAGLAVLALAAGCSSRLYEGAERPPQHVAVINVGSTIVREFDGDRRRGGAFDVSRFEVPPGLHRIALVFELPAHSLGMKSIPAQSGTGVCILELQAEAGKQYFLGSRARGEPHMPRWDGAWEGWVRDPSVSSEDDVVARCLSQEPPPQIAAAPEPDASPAAEVAPPPAVALPPIPPPPTETTIRLGEWNLRSLGGREDKDTERIAAAIDANFDILAITEVFRPSGRHQGYDMLRAHLPSTWDGLIKAGPLDEGYAILYRRDIVRPCSGWDGLRETALAGFARPPVFACFAAGPADAPTVDFMFAVYRATTADGDASDVAAEVAQLDTVFAAMRDAHPGEEDLIIAGDFNLDSTELRHALDAADRTQGRSSVLTLFGELSPRLSDHVVVSDSAATGEMLGNAQPIDLRDIAGSPAEYYRAISDHLPIVVRLRIAGGDDD